MSILMLGFILLLLLINIISFTYIVHVILYNVKGLHFLEYAKSFLLENEEIDEVKILVNNDIPLFKDYLLASKGMLYFVIITIFINMFIVLFVIFPIMHKPAAWIIITWTAALTNAFIILSFHSYHNIKVKINATCESYNVLMQAYDYIKEYEDDNNDSSN